ncbi:peptidoglycan-associated lipoprotein Pal [Piscinibacter sp. XHJ-5]|uniref:peptidoglycan-associated lipoprotein Pal n=1 Tax=Piscinibacter sp. XHJ-5 TaxID=3037797 RepID=UPI0024535432|nr:peptidoglycan-associated lipoprotein Pal [Piscinibacter sp. XHJ-5]
MRVAQQAFVASAVAALLAGCGSNVKLDDKQTPVETRTPTAVNPGAGAGGTPQSQVTSVDLTKNANAAQSNLPRVVYFDFDSFVVKDEFRPTIDAHAKVLSTDRKKKLAIEGHTDERGGREYNLALGQKRAEAVAKSLTLLGAQDTQLEAVSFGKERPAASGSDESAWAKNRRAELTYR